MKPQRFALALTIFNLVLLMIVLALLMRPVVSPNVAPVLRGRALEIVDDQGRVRAQIIIAPATTSRDGTVYPETVLFRLSDPNGRPAVKLGASVDGSGLLLSGDSERTEWSGVQILGKDSLLRLIKKDGQERTITP